jgi:hypothetical protein
MTATRQMLQTYPGEVPLDREALASTIDALISCSEACVACADACLGEAKVADLTKCVRLDLDCSDMCTTTSRILARQTAYDATIAHAVLEACVLICHACADECEKHASMHEHCRVSANECRACERACRALLDTMG